MLTVKKTTSKVNISKKETITSVMDRILDSITNKKLAEAKRLYNLAVIKWGKNFSKYYGITSSSKLTKANAKSALAKKKSLGKKVKAKKDGKYAKKTTIYKEGEVFTPVWDVWISGTKLNLDKKNLITSLQIKETVDGSDTAVLQVVDPDFKFIEDNIFIEDNTITIKMGWSAYTYRCTFKGYISAVDISFTSEGKPTLTINCMDRTYRMYRKDKSKTWRKKSSASIVKSICKSYGYKCVTQKNYKFKTQSSITQSNQSDIEFIQKLAQDETRPFTARLVGNTFYYIKKGVIKKTSDYILHYKEYPSDVVSFSPKINHIVKTKSNAASTNKKSKTTSATSSSENVKQGSTSSGKREANSKSSKKGSSVNTVTSTVKRDTTNRVWKK